MASPIAGSSPRTTDHRVHSPCGKFLVTLTLAFDSSSAPCHAWLNITEKESNVVYRSERLDASIVDAITAASGVKRPLPVFLRMLHSGVVGNSQALSFYVTTAAEFLEQTDAGIGGATRAVESVRPSDDAELRLFVLDYNVDFCRALFVIEARLARHYDRDPVGSPSVPVPGPVAAESPSVPRLPPMNPSDPVGSLKAALEHQTREVERLTEENAALRRMSESALRDMAAKFERMRDTVERSDVGAARRELARTRQELDEATRRNRQLQLAMADLARQVARAGGGTPSRTEEAALSRRSRSRSTTPPPLGRNRSPISDPRTLPRGVGARFNRFDTPPKPAAVAPPPRGRSRSPVTSSPYRSDEESISSSRRSGGGGGGSSQYLRRPTSPAVPLAPPRHPSNRFDTPPRSGGGAALEPRRSVFR